MAKKRKTIGSIVKGKDGKPDYIKISQDVALKTGQFVNLESKKGKLESIEKGIASGKLSAELATKLRTQAEKMPEFVRFDLTITEEV